MIHRRWGVASLAGAVLLASLAACASASGPPRSTSQGTGPVAAIIRVGQRPGVPVAGAGAVWVPNTADGTISRIDPRSNRVTATIRIGDQPAFYHRACEEKWNVHAFMGPSFHVRDCDLPSALATSGSSVWVLKNDDQSVIRIDPATEKITARIPLGFTPFDIAGTDRAVWVTGYYDDQLVRIDPADNTVVARLTLPDGVGGVATSDMDVWVTSTIAGSVSHIDARSNQVIATVPLPCPGVCLQGSAPLAVAIGPDGIWVRTNGDGLLVRVDPESNRIIASFPVTVSVGRDGQDHMASLNGALWVSGTSLQRVDPASNRVAATLGVNVTSVNAGYASIWATDVFGKIERISPGS